MGTLTILPSTLEANTKKYRKARISVMRAFLCSQKIHFGLYKPHIYLLPFYRLGSFLPLLKFGFAKRLAFRSAF